MNLFHKSSKGISVKEYPQKDGDELREVDYHAVNCRHDIKT